METTQTIKLTDAEQPHELPGSGWGEIIKKFSPFGQGGERNPLAKKLANTQGNPIWERSLFQKAAENFKMPFGLSGLRQLKDWGEDFSSALAFNSALLEHFTILTSKVDPRVIESVMSQMDTMTNESELVIQANEFIGAVWKNIESGSGSEPKKIDKTALLELTTRAESNPQFGAVCLLTLRNYFIETLGEIYSVSAGKSYPTSPDDIENKLIEDSFLYNWGITFRKDPQKSRFDLTANDLTKDGTNHLGQYTDFYKKLFATPFFTTNEFCEKTLDEQGDKATGVMILYRFASDRALKN